MLGLRPAERRIALWTLWNPPICSSSIPMSTFLVSSKTLQSNVPQHHHRRAEREKSAFWKTPGSLLISFSHRGTARPKG